MLRHSIKAFKKCKTALWGNYRLPGFAQNASQRKMHSGWKWRLKSPTGERSIFSKTRAWWKPRAKVTAMFVQTTSAPKTIMSSCNVCMLSTENAKDFSQSAKIQRNCSRRSLQNQWSLKQSIMPCGRSDWWWPTCRTSGNASQWVAFRWGAQIMDHDGKQHAGTTTGTKKG